MNDAPTKDTAENIRDTFKRWPRLYFFIATVFGPLMFCGQSGKRFLQKYGKEGICLNLGSGPRSLGEGVINVDIHAYPGVSVVADITSLPFEEGSVSRIVCDNVLEHVKSPATAVREMHRVLVRGGLAYISTPFLYPFHSSPSDYQRWTYRGLLELTKEFTAVEGGNRAGPFSALCVWLCYLFSSVLSFGNRRAYWILVNASIFIFFPVKLLDIVGNHFPFANNLAAVLYIVIRKE